MTPPNAEDRILEYLEGEMTPDQERAFLADVAADPALRTLLEEYQQQDRMLENVFHARREEAERIPHPDLASLPSAVAGGRNAEGRSRTMAWWIASAAAVAVALTAVFTLLRPDGERTEIASVLNASGHAQVFTAGESEALRRGQRLASDVTMIKTPDASYLELDLPASNALLEMNENSTIRFDRQGETSPVELVRGEILVNARALDESIPTRVTTPYATVESRDALFSVARGLRGAEVRVLRGDVELRGSDGRRRLAAGQAWSSTGANPISASLRVAWSRHREDYKTFLPAEELTLPTETASEEVAVAEVTRETSPTDAAITSSTTAATADTMLLANFSSGSPTTEWLPEETFFFVELPDISTLMRDNGGESLADLILSAKGKDFVARSMTTVVGGSGEDVAEFRAQLEERLSSAELNTVLDSLQGSITFAVTADGFVAISQMTDPNGTATALVNGPANEWLEEHGAGDDKHFHLAAIGGYLLAGYGKGAEETRQALSVYTPTSFARSDFMAEVRRLVPGSEFTAALNARPMITRNKRAEQVYERLGLGNLSSIVAATSFADQAENRAIRMTFDGERRGIMSWIGAPAPLSGFQFFSPDTHVMANLRVRRPQMMFDQLLTWSGINPASLQGQDSVLPLEGALREVLSTLGNEVAIGLDNPVLPIPNVKLAVEVLDPIAFHDGMLAFLQLREQTLGFPVEITADVHRDHLLVDVKFATTGFGFSYAILHDYAVFAPARPFLRNTIDIFVDGHTLDQEAAFWQALPANSGSWCSGLVYVAPSTSGMSDALPILQQYLRSSGVPIDLRALAQAGSGTSPSVYYVIAESERIDFYIEGVKGDYQMGGLIPSVAQWLTDRAEP